MLIAINKSLCYTYEIIKASIPHESMPFYYETSANRQITSTMANMNIEYVKLFILNAICPILSLMLQSLWDCSVDAKLSLGEESLKSMLSFNL